MIKKFLQPLVLIKIAIGLASFFVVALHPISTALGGFSLLLTGWAIPDVINFLIALSLAAAIAVPFIFRMLVFFVATIGLAVLPSVPELIRLTRFEMKTETEIIKAIDVTGRARTTFSMDRTEPVFPFPLKPRVKVGGNEGCMCLYFDINQNATYEGNLVKIINRINGDGGITKINYDIMPSNNYHFRLLTPSDNDNKFMIVLEVYDNGERTAVFRQRGLPVSIHPHSGDIAGKLNGENFWGKTIEVLLKNTYLAGALTRFMPSYFPHAEIENFLKAAIVRH